ncbi:MAG: DEAD/DEAH box helicase [Actinobacteria bacterium]|nr:DEAD/DEAH box helicase [Actinomycetota bacterium]
MKYLYKLVDEINTYNGSLEAANRLRDLICFISDNEKYRSDILYRTALFDAAQKMRTFGYIKGDNKIDLDEISKEGLYDIKHQTIQNFYASKVYRNNLLDKRQKEIIDEYMSLKKRRLIISAPTSFGKTFLLREIIYLNEQRYNNILLVFPTVALLNENTANMKRFITDLDLNYSIVNNVYSKVDITSRNIYILTPERTLKLLSDHEALNIDFFFFDEVYKIDEDFSKDEDSMIDSSENKNTVQDKGNRAKAFRVTLYILSKMVKEYYIAGPYLNLTSVKSGFQKYLMYNDITVKQIDFEPTIRIEIDAWNKKIIEHHPLVGDNELGFYDKGNMGTKDKICRIASYLERNNLGQAIFYCANPSYSMQYAKSIIDFLPVNKKVIQRHGSFIEHLKKRYGVNHRFKGKVINTSDYWSLIQILTAGYGVHHGKFPKYIQKEVLKMFDAGDIDYLFCTSTIIEGVNTNAKNVVIINNSVGSNPMTPFALKNIKGRAGRYYHHFVGRIFYIDKKQRQVEQQEDLMLNFSIYDDIPILNVDLDNAVADDLAESNKRIKLVRESKFNKTKLSDKVFIKNRLFQRDIQEKYLDFFLKEQNFTLFKGLIGNTYNIHSFLQNKMMNTILDSVAQVGIIDDRVKGLYHAVVSKYSIEKFKGLMEYQLGSGLSEPEKEIDKMYLKVFGQIKNIIEYEVPKLLCLFEAIYQQAGRIKGYNMDDFNLSAIIRFFELGVTTALGIYLVEFGYPIDAIRLIEDKFSTLSTMDLNDSLRFIRKNINYARSFLDNYEMELLYSAIEG